MKKSLIAIVAFLTTTIFLSSCEEEKGSSKYVSEYTYDMPDGEVIDKKVYCNSDFFAFENETNKLVTNTDSLGILTFNSNIVATKDKDGFMAYGVDKPVSLSYTITYDVKINSDNINEWHLIEESKKEIKNYQKFTGSVGSGLLLIEKSYDDVKYENAVLPLANFYKDYSGNVNDFYTLDYSDVVKGTYYKVSFAYTFGKKIGTTGWWLWEKPKFEYKRYLETYKFYIIEYNKTVLIHNLSIDLPSASETEKVNLEMLSKTETLNDGDTTTGGFSIDKNGRSIDVFVSHNGGNSLETKDGQEFKENGYYSITTVNPFGDKETTNVFVFNGGSDSGFGTYFGSDFINGQRVFRFVDYPSYARNSYINVEASQKYTPNLYGQLINTDTGEKVLLFEGSAHDKINRDLYPGEYIGEFYSGRPNSGSYYRYSFHFNIVDSDAKPYVNIYNLSSTLKLSSFKPKHYEVAYQMTKGGYVNVCFSENSYQDALDYAYEIEKRFIEKADDGSLFYKSPNDPNTKIKYKDNIKLTSTLYEYAEKNISIEYFNPSETFSYRTLDNNDLSSLEDLNLNYSIRVFPSAFEREKMRSNERYLNDFSFIKVADYDVVDAEIYCHADGSTTKIEFGKSMNEQLSKDSRYTITERNIYNLTRSYDAYYVTKNTTLLKFDVCNNKSIKSVIVSSDNHYEIDADYIKFVDFENELDPESLISISAPNVYSYEGIWNASELKDVVLYKKGNYLIKSIDRFGNVFDTNVKISGKAFYEDVTDESKTTLTDKYNSNHIQKIEIETEEETVTINDLINLIATKVSKGKFSNKDYKEYLSALDNANSVAENPSSTRKDISSAYVRLKIAMAKQKTAEDTNTFWDFVRNNLVTIILGAALLVAVIIIIVLLKRG